MTSDKILKAPYNMYVCDPLNSDGGCKPNQTLREAKVLFIDLHSKL